MVVIEGACFPDFIVATQTSNFLVAFTTLWTLQFISEAVMFEISLLQKLG